MGTPIFYIFNIPFKYYLVQVHKTFDFVSFLLHAFFLKKGDIKILLPDTVFFLFRAAPAAYGSSQVRDPSGTAAAGLHHRHGNAPRTPQLTAVADP